MKALKKEKHHSFKLTGSLPRRAAKLVFEWLDLHEKELIENWERLKNSQQPQKIEPLK